MLACGLPDVKGHRVNRLHFIVGLLGVAAFLGTGLFMEFAHDHLRGKSDALRLLYRSTHVYLLLTSLLNLAVSGATLQITGWRQWLRRLGSLALLIAPLLALAAFAIEPALTGLSRPLTLPMAFFCLGGMAFHTLSRLPTRPPR
jgi:hypothetical protein